MTRYKSDPNWQGELVVSDSESDDSSIGYDSETYQDELFNTEAPPRYAKGTNNTENLGTSNVNMRIGNEGIEVRISPSRFQKDKLG